MIDDIRMILLLAGREFRDQARDWRIIVPLTILTVGFPVLMSEVARQAVAFFARFGTTLIADRLVPFSILIIGFFPITVSLVVALESFVGEKERGTIEPLLNAPLKDWHLYCGKLLAGSATPIVSSYISVTLYLAMAAHQGLQLPPVQTLVLLVTLTTVHALLMVSGALVISVQSTSIRAANLLASFVIIPVALMLQGESVLLFWGTDDVLWLAVLAVIVMSVLLIRLGLAHFQREYLIGRELDQLDIRWIWRTFWQALTRRASGAASWFRFRVGGSLRALSTPFALVVVVGVLAFWASFEWSATNLPIVLSSVDADQLKTVIADAQEATGVIDIGSHRSAVGIFSNNVRATAVLLILGLVSFSVLGLGAYVLNVGLIGAVLAIFGILGYEPAVIFAAGVLPHGLFELPALMLATAMVLRIGAVLVTPQAGRSMGQVLLEQLAEGVTVLVGVVWPLLAVAAIIEAYATPGIFAGALR